MPSTSIDVPTQIDAPDGGVDAIVNDAPHDSKRGIFFEGSTGYQVKSGNATLSGDAAIRDLLLKPSAVKEIKKEQRAPTREDINSRILDLIDAGGAFVVFMSGSDVPDTKEINESQNRILGFLTNIDPAFKAVRIAIWRQNQICAIVNQFPSIASRIGSTKGELLVLEEIRTHHSDLEGEFSPDAAQIELIDALREMLSAPARSSPHIRITGEPGIGKTRLLVEALSTADLARAVLYTDKSENFLDSPEFREILARGQDLEAILVVDECGPDERSAFRRSLKKTAPGLHVVTVYLETEEADTSSQYAHFSVSPLSDDVLAEILVTQYGTSPEDSKHWASLCGGSPRVVHMVGANLREHPDDILYSNGLVDVWRRYVAGHEDKNSESAKKQELIICSLALFTKFGFNKPLEADAMHVYENIVARLDAGISRADFSDGIRRFLQRKVLQGNSTLNITPRLFHVWCWVQWWERWGNWLDVAEIYTNLPQEMKQWFGDMFVYARESEAAGLVVERLLSGEGPFADPKFVETDDGGRFFFQLTLTRPQEGLQFLMRTLGPRSKEELFAFHEGRQHVVRALKKIARHRDLFRDAANLLLALAEAENQRYSNNASGEFAELFSLGVGQMSPTEADPAFRLPVLDAALLSESETVGGLALRAFDMALKFGSRTRVVDEDEGLDRGTWEWRPTKWPEVFAAYRLYWDNLLDFVNSGSSLAPEARAILLRHARSLLRIPDLEEEVLGLLKRLGSGKEFDELKVLKAIEKILHFDSEKMPGELVEKLVQIRDQIVGVDYRSHLRRYVGLNLIEDQFSREGEPADQTVAHIDRLARESVENPERFSAEVDWLVTGRAENGFQFGRALGRADTERNLYGIIVRSFKNAQIRSDSVLGGYLAEVFTRKPEEWEAMLDDLCSERSTREMLLELTWRSGLSDRAVERILRLVDGGVIPAERLRLFSFGGFASAISQNSFLAVLRTMLACRIYEAGVAALDFVQMRLYGTKGTPAIPVRIFGRVLFNSALLARTDKRGDSGEYHWAELAKRYSKGNLKRAKRVIEYILSNFHRDRSIFDGSSLGVENLLDELIEAHPRAGWRIVSNFLEDPDKIFWMQYWINGRRDRDSEAGGGPLGFIPTNAIWAWADEKPKSRPPLLASLIPFDFGDTGRRSLWYKILKRYGASADVRAALTANFLSGGWSGPESQHYTRVAESISPLSEDSDQNASLWGRETVQMLENMAEQSAVREERRGY